MSDRFAESVPDTVSDIVELALYSTSVLFIVTLGLRSSLTLPQRPRCPAGWVFGRRKSPWPA